MGIILLAMALTAAPGGAAQKSCAAGPIVVSGIVDKLGSFQQEPAAAPQVSFILRHPSCGNADILVSTPAPVFCADGDRVTVRGDYIPPGKFIATPIVTPARVTCQSPK